MSLATALKVLSKEFTSPMRVRKFRLGSLTEKQRLLLRLVQKTSSIN